MAGCSKNFDLANPKDVEEVQRLLWDEEDVLLQEDFEDESDTDAEDAVETREENSETEQEDEDTDDELVDDNETYFMGKDKETKWRTAPYSSRVRSGAHNIIRKLPGVIGNARNADTPLECWSYLITNDILEIIVNYTNQYIDHIKTSFQRQRDAKYIDLAELKAFIGLLFLAGVHRGNRQSLEDLWGSEGDGIEKFRLVMSIKRFKFIMRCLRFDDRTTREERKKIDKLAAIREIFSIFVNNCQQNYSLGVNVTIDEKLEGFRGRCSFRQYIPSKPNKYGLKIYALVDAEVFYLYNLEIYAGLQPEGQYRTSNKPYDVVLRLSQPIFGSGRNITADNWFSSIGLLEQLKSKKLSYVGTLKKNKPQIPLQFITGKQRAVNSSLFGFRKDCTLVSYIPKKGKCVVLVSSLHGDKAIDKNTGDQQKPAIITFYNKTKGGVDTTDKLCASYNVARNVRRWPMVIFFAMINMSGINAQVLHLGNGQKRIRRKAFLKKLSHELVLPHLIRRSQQTVGMPQELQERLKQYRPQTPLTNRDSKDNQEVAVGGKRKRCEDCQVPSAKRRLTKYNCKKCKKAICLNHLDVFCFNCSQNMPLEVVGNLEVDE